MDRDVLNVTAKRNVPCILPPQRHLALGRIDPKGKEDGDGGEVQWVSVMRFEHKNGSLIDFSHCEKYLVTFNETEPERDDKRNPCAVLVWDILTGREKRGLLETPRSINGPDGQNPWTMFLWSQNDKYVLRINDNDISVYQTFDMDLLKKCQSRYPMFRNSSGHMWTRSWCTGQRKLQTRQLYGKEVCHVYGKEVCRVELGVVRKGCATEATT